MPWALLHSHCLLRVKHILLSAVNGWRLRSGNTSMHQFLLLLMRPFSSNWWMGSLSNPPILISMQLLVPCFFNPIMDNRSTVVSNLGLAHLMMKIFMLTFETLTEHAHFHHGFLVLCKLIHRKFPAKKIVYVSKNPKVVVIFQGHHSHPPWPEKKPSWMAKDDLQKCLDALGILGATADRVDNGGHKKSKTLKTQWDHVL